MATQSLLMNVEQDFVQATGSGALSAGRFHLVSRESATYVIPACGGRPIYRLDILDRFRGDPDNLPGALCGHCARKLGRDGLR